jgi:hypothetical protein
VPTLATGFNYYSQDTIFRPGRLSSIVEVKRIQGPIFNSKEEAEQHELQLCKALIDKMLLTLNGLTGRVKLNKLLYTSSEVVHCVAAAWE